MESMRDVVGGRIVCPGDLIVSSGNDCTVAGNNRFERTAYVELHSPLGGFNSGLYVGIHVYIHSACPNLPLFYHVILQVPRQEQKIPFVFPERVSIL